VSRPVLRTLIVAALLGTFLVSSPSCSDQNKVKPPRDDRKTLKSALNRYRKNLHPIPTRPIKFKKEEEETLLKRLRALGYVETTTPR
jgi:hypothetical protein